MFNAACTAVPEGRPDICPGSGLGSSPRHCGNLRHGRFGPASNRR